MSIVITGNPGVGKHTITQGIANRLDLDIIDINKIAKNSGLFERNKETNDIDVIKLEKILEPRISKENIIVGHLAPYVLRKNKVKTMIVLRRNPYHLISVYKDREYSNKKIKENTSSEILGIIAHDAINKFQEKVFQVNVSEMTIPETIEKTINLISSNNGNEEVDWLELIRKNNDFGRFFVD